MLPRAARCSSQGRWFAGVISPRPSPWMKTTTLLGRPCGRKIQTWSAPLPIGPSRPMRVGAAEGDDEEPQPTSRSASSATAPARPERFSDFTLELLHAGADEPD